MKTIFNLDKDINNADWTKGTWDIPVNNIDDLNHWLEAYEITREHFITLPIYQFNKHKFVWLASLEDTPQKIFYEDHQRKYNAIHMPHSGQFGRATAGFASLTDAENHIQGKYPGLTADFKGCNLGLINEALPPFIKAMDKYPSAASHIVFLGTGNGKASPGYAPPQKDGAYATTGHGRISATEQHYAITMQDKYWSDPLTMQLGLALSGQKGFFAVKQPNAGYVLVHELGHAVTLDIALGSDDKAFMSKVGGDGVGKVAGTLENFVKNNHKSVIAVSGYSARGFQNSGQYNEPLAEMFAGVQLAPGKRMGIIARFNYVLKKIIPHGSENGWTNNYEIGSSPQIDRLRQLMPQPRQYVSAPFTFLLKADGETLVEWHEDTGQFPDDIDAMIEEYLKKQQEQKFNSFHESRTGRFGSGIGVAPGQIEDAGSMSYFPTKDQGKIMAYAKINGVSASYGIGASTKLIEASKASGHYEADADWYNRTGAASNALAKMTGITREQSAGIIAAMSPRNRWDRLSKEGMVTMPNIKDAINLAKMHQANPLVTITPEIAAKMKPYDKASGNLSAMVGTSKHLNDFTPIQAGYLSMGHVTGYAVNSAKAYKILRGEPVASVLGGPKVRSFYNNIHNPQESSSVTVDTWMVRILSGKNTATPQQLSAILSRPNSGAIRGIGSYPLFADMIKTVAATYKISPHAAQAVIWEQARREQGQGVTVDTVKGWYE